MTQARLTQDRSNQEASRRGSTNPSPLRRKILIVDDDAVIRTLLVDVLTDPTYQLDTANNGADAIEKLERQYFDLVVTDMVMPKANGLDVLLASKRLEPNRPVIIVTGFPSVATAVKLASLGAADYVTKPFDVDLIRITVAKVLAQHDFAQSRLRGGEHSLPASSAGTPGLYDSTIFNQLLEKEIARSRLRDRRFCLMVAEFDGFEKAMLGASSDHREARIGLLFEAVRRHIRPGDYVGRTESEQLSVILPETSQAEATRVCGRVSSVDITGLGIVATAVSFPEDAADGETLRSRATTAIQAARSGTV